MKTPLVLSITVFTISLASLVHAQEGGPYLTRGEDSRVLLKRAQWSRWVPLGTLYQPLGRQDSVSVQSGRGVRLFREEDHYIELEPGERYRVGDALQQNSGVLVRLGGYAADAVRTLSTLIIQQPTSAVRTTHALVQRWGNEAPPALLFTATDQPSRVAAEAPDLVWLPSTSAADTTIRLRVFEAALAGCQRGELVLDTLVTGYMLPATVHSLLLTGGGHYRVELANAAGELHDVGCFVAATPEERVALEAKISEVRRDLGGTVGGDSADFDAAVHVASLLAHEGYYYDAFLVLDPLLERYPDDPGLRTIWAALLAEAGVLGSLVDQR
jgi:hypothetical protein